MKNISLGYLSDLGVSIYGRCLSVKDEKVIRKCEMV